MRLLVWPMIAASFAVAATTPEDPLAALLAMPEYGALLGQSLRALHLDRPEAAAALRGVLDKMEADRLPSASLFPVRIALTTAYLRSGDLRHTEEILLETTRSQSGISGDLAAAELANNWGCLHLKQSRFEQARTEFEQALNRLAANPAAWQLTPSLFENLAVSEIRLGFYHEALPHQQEALSRWSMSFPADHVKLIKAYATLASIQYLSNDSAAAEVSMRIAIDAGRQFLGNRSPLMADMLENYAIILRRLDQKREARAAETEASHISRPKSAGPTALTVDVKALMRACSLGCSQSLR